MGAPGGIPGCDGGSGGGGGGGDMRSLCVDWTLGGAVLITLGAGDGAAEDGALRLPTRSQPGCRRLMCPLRTLVVAARYSQ